MVSRSLAYLHIYNAVFIPALGVIEDAVSYLP